ncbi:Protein of unknown function [Gryllus bimaculatus]|nr:Protein of unknown function [Gryllus bimaculatus]
MTHQPTPTPPSAKKPPPSGKTREALGTTGGEGRGGRHSGRKRTPAPPPTRPPHLVVLRSRPKPPSGDVLVDSGSSAR